MSNTTDAMYNEASRLFTVQLKIYFTDTPLVITKANYLLNFSILDECSSLENLLLGSVTANEISFSLLNDNRIFTPLNTASPYFGRMRRGVKVEAFIKPTEDEAVDFDSIGVFYVDTWIAQATGTIADITALDDLYRVKNARPYIGEVIPNTTVGAYFATIFNALSATADVDASLTNALKMAYNLSDNGALLSDLSSGSLAYCFCKHDGNIKVQKIQSMLAAAERATITDADQIISVDITQTLEVDYDSVCVTANVPQEDPATVVLDLPNYVLTPGINVISMDLTEIPLVRLMYASITNTLMTKIVSISATANHAYITIRNDSPASVTSNIQLFGTKVTMQKIEKKDDGNSPLSLNSLYIQSEAVADSVKAVLDSAVDVDTPFILIQTRGNCKFELGDKIHAISEKYNLDVVGILIRQTFEYNGGLSSAITLLNANIFNS